MIAPRSLATLTADDFRPLQGQPFTLELAADVAVAAVLVEVAVWPQHRRLGATRDPFAITLRVPPGTSALQGTYALTHPDLGRLEVFFTPVRPTPEGPRLQAVFT